MDKALIISHVAAGIISLISGLLAAFFGKKGGKFHLQVGRVFFWSMFWIFISALAIISFIRFNAFLLVIAVFSFYMAFAGVRVLKIKKTMKVARIDWVAAIITALFGIAMFGWGLNNVLTGQNPVFGYLCLFFGFFTTNTARINMVGFKRIENAEKMWWWFSHMGAMVGSFIASITAFLVQNGMIFGLPNNLSWLPWVLPALIGVPVTSYYANKYRQKFKVGKYASSPAK